MVVRHQPAGWEVCLVRAGRYWGLPKGHVEAGESPLQAAAREVSEECDIPVSLLHIAGELAPSEYVYRRQGRLMFKLVHQFLVVVPPNTPVAPQAGEIDEVEWLSFDSATERSSFGDTRTALAAARALLGGLRTDSA